MKESNANETIFYGYASITAGDICRIKLDGKKSLKLKASPTFKNPFHADIILPVDEGKDLYLAIADALQRKAKFVESI